MESISLYLEKYLQKFSKFKFGDLLLKEAIIEAVKEIFNYELEKNSISTKDGVVYIKTSPIIKNEIFINKKAILEKIQKKLDQKIQNIR
jgi:hypothetical protein